MLPRARKSWGPVVLVLGVAGCGGEASLTDPTPPVACNLAAPVGIGVPSLLPPDARCLTLNPAARYALAYFDTRFVESSRVASEAGAADLEDFLVTVTAQPGHAVSVSQTTAERSSTALWGGRGAQPAEVTGVVPPPYLEGQTLLSRDRWVRIPRSEAEDPDAVEQKGREGEARALPEACRRAPGFEVFCRDRPWSPGDTLTIPARFGMFIDEVPRAAEILLVQGPFAFAVSRDLSASQRALIRPLLSELALVGRVRILPLLRRAFLDRPVFTSTGSRQILVDALVDVAPVCVCGVAVGHFVEGVGVAAVSIRLPIGPEFEAQRIGLLAHELAHMWQHAFAIQRATDPARGAPLTTVWAREGGADFVRQEILRGLAAEPLDGNRDADSPVGDPFLERWLRDLGVADGRIRNGYAQSAGLFRHLFVRALGAGGNYDEALRAILLGSLEGWFGTMDSGATGTGLTDRLSVPLPSFEPTAAILEYALANAVDDRTRNSNLQNPAVLEAWRRSLGSRFIPAASVQGRGGGATIRRSAGSAGYLYVESSSAAAALQLSSDVEGVRWMVVRFD